MIMPSRRRIAVFMLVLQGVLAACGLKTDPLVPDSPRPEQIRGVKVVTRGAEAFLSWPLPSKNIEGKSMSPSDIQEIRIYRAEFVSEHRKARYRLYADIDMQDAAPAAVRGNMVFWTDDNVKYGHTYGYQIRAVSVRGGVSQPSEVVRITPAVPPAIPKNMSATGQDGSVRLTWDPVTRRLDGSAPGNFIGYNVYRGNEKGRYDETPLNGAPLSTATYSDLSAANGRTYYYIVRSVDSPVRPWLESPDSSSGSATPRDSTPPARPGKLTVVPGMDRVFLTWNENSERDLAGYYVYRSTRSGKGYDRLTDKPVNRTTYSDETVVSGSSYFYVVTAVDRSGNESDRSNEGKAILQKIK